MNELPPRCPRVLFVAYGNPGRGDDGAAWLVADSIEERWGNRIDILRFHQLDIVLAERFAQCDVVIFVDAETTETAQGRSPTLLTPSAELREVTHILDPAALLGLGQAIYHARPRAYLVTVFAHRFEFGDAISPETRSDIDRAVRDIENLLHEVLPS